jgi:hypothetical protein
MALTILCISFVLLLLLGVPVAFSIGLLVALHDPLRGPAAGGGLPAE